ncbi:pyruvate dehydrogenase E2 component (dihydrolipoamide acetyltransferase) [Microbacterium sp. AK009]|uniref:dihydrolipoamide acetyltransferase family protein n=1 Tax=Microbacterium sp. AK009 TaxID=2723068 RepID=UPI0015CA8795|nr:dihydrolipoamide acetyltransferase family protein [Microbacterium sp. AK009]NYF16211.1 pyruvate dehydrogenase E2 component (dihydrolipoamide acetyltransferase) [Microbacterium sp. AK009]
MIQEFRLPDLGEGLPEAELVQWLVAEGDRVTLNQTIAEVETAKAVVELPSPHAGVVQVLHAAAGDVVEVGAPLISFDVGAGEPGSPAAPHASSTAGDEPGAGDAVATDAPADDAAGPNLVGYGAAPRSGNRPRRRPRIAASASPSPAADTALLSVAPHDDIRLVETVEQLQERPRSTPPVRKLAKDLGVDIALVEGTGQGGLITRDDVRTYAETTTRVAEPVKSSPARDAAHTSETRIPIRGVRKHTAEAMVRSAFTAPHVTVFLTVDVTETTELVASLREDRSLADHRIGVLAVAAKAVCLALRRHPTLNSRWDGESGEIVQYHGVHLGIAAATERGLVVPNIRDADRMTLPALADAIRDLATTARAGKTSPEAMRGGTFSITNVGVFGVDAGTPILNPGEAGILALGAVRRQPWEHRGQIALRDVVTLALSFDHRLVDGEQGSRFLADVGAVLREPGRAMLLA